MPISSERWKTITESQFPWEREALDFVREGLPDLAHATFVPPPPHEMGQAVIGMESQWNLYGVAWGFDELDKARSNVHLAWQNYEDLKRVFRQRVKRFIRETQKM